MFKEYFNFESPTALTKQLYKIKNKKENNELVNVINRGLNDLKDEIKKCLRMKKNLKNQIKY